VLYFVVGILCNGSIKTVGGYWRLWGGFLLFFLSFSKASKFGWRVFTSRIDFCLKNYQSMKQLLPGHSSSLSNLLSVPKHILFFFINCGLWLWCAARLHESDMRKEICAGRQGPWRHEPYALIFFLYFLIAFLYEGNNMIPCSLHWQHNVEACLPLGEPKGPVCSHMETVSDLKYEWFIVASIRLTAFWSVDSVSINCLGCAL